MERCRVAAVFPSSAKYTATAHLQVLENKTLKAVIIHGQQPLMVVLKDITKDLETESFVTGVFIRRQRFYCKLIAAQLILPSPYASHYLNYLSSLSVISPSEINLWNEARFTYRIAFMYSAYLHL